MKRIALTTGDINGIGCEVAAKALRTLKLKPDQKIAVFMNPKSIPEFKRHFRKSFTTSASLKNFGKDAKSSKENLFLISSEAAPALWVEEVAHACMAKQIDALVTGPLSKPGIRDAGLKDLGHTEILGRISGEHDLFMSFWGSLFNVVLVTGHIPLQEVPDAYTTKRILKSAALTRDFMKALGQPVKSKKIAWMGLNPHAGDKNLIGSQESQMLRQIAKSTLAKNLIGPLIPDAAFTRPNWNRFAAYLCAYHDQGLIPFKMAHGFDEGVHVTLGLPFLRTSVDHGPAIDLVGTGKAKYGSMKSALQMALDFKPASR